MGTAHRIATPSAVTHEAARRGSNASSATAAPKPHAPNNCGAGSTYKSGTTANAQVAGAYEVYRRRMRTDRATALLAAGAQVQRPLWASTSTKNPTYFDLLYVDKIVADETVNTMPDATLDAVLDHGDFASSLLFDEASTEAAASALTELPADISLEAVTEKLEVDGVASFVASYEELLATVAKKIEGTK